MCIRDRLEQLLGWHGLCIEPNPKYHPGFEAYRRCALAKTCVTAEKREVEFELSGGKGHITSSGGAKKSLKLTCEPLSTLLAHHKMRAITYLSLDVEGGELDALRGVDWNTTTIDVLTVETASAELTAFLEARGFARVFCVALDSVFVAACVEINILRRVRAASSRRPPRHRRDAWTPDALVDFHTGGSAAKEKGDRLVRPDRADT